MTSVVMFSAGIGTIFFTIFSKEMINPDNELPSIYETPGPITYKYFAPEIANRFPEMLRTIVIILLLISVIIATMFYVPQ